MSDHTPLFTSLQEFLETLFQHLGIEAENITVSPSETELIVSIQVDAEESGRLIGHHGMTLESLQRIVQVYIAEHKTENFELSVVVNVNGYREQRIEQLENLATTVANRVAESGQSESLAFLSSVDRKTIHVFLKEHPTVETFSEGEGSQRRLVVAVKQSA